MRRATRTDIPAMLELHRGGSTSAWSPEHYENLFRTDAPELSCYYVLVIEEPCESSGVTESAPTSPIVAHLVAHGVGSEWQLQYIVVSQKSRRRGLATLLLNEFIEHARRENAPAIFLEVRESNQSARALYCNAGFQETGVRKGYYPSPPEDAIVYRLALS